MCYEKAALNTLKPEVKQALVMPNTFNDVYKTLLLVTIIYYYDNTIEDVVFSMVMRNCTRWYPLHRLTKMVNKIKLVKFKSLLIQVFTT